MAYFIALVVLYLAAVLSASPINSDPRPHEFIIAKTDSKDLSGEGKYKIIEIIPYDDIAETENISKRTGSEHTDSEPETQNPNIDGQNENKENSSEPQKENLAKILEEVKESVPEEQKYNEQNPEPESEKSPKNPIEKIEILLRTAKPEVQKHDEQNPEPVSETQDVTSGNEVPEQHNFKPQYTQDVITRVIDQTHNGPSYAEIIEIQPDSETLKHYNSPHTIETKNSIVDGSGKPKVVEIYKPKYVVPEAPVFTTRISVPPLPISLSSLRSLRLNWPHEVPSIFKAPRIIYLGHQ